MEPILIFTIFLSFFCTYLILPYFIKRAQSEGLIGKDMHKRGDSKIAEGGGLCVLFGATVGILLYIAINTFYFKDSSKLIEIFALLGVLFISAIVGLIDDVLGWKRGLNRKTRLLIILFSAIPLMVINAGNSNIMGINFGILYPLIIIPLGIIGATTTFNFLAGYNGLEAGQGILILSALSVITFMIGNRWLSLVALCMIASLIAFYIFNKYPAKIFPGDSLTYPIGALIATIAIIGNIEKIALIFFFPYIIETILKIRGRLKKESFARLNEDGSLDMPYERIYGLEHLAISVLKKIKSSHKAYEKEVVWMIYGFQMIFILIGFLIFLF